MILLIYDPDYVSYSIEVFRENLVPELVSRVDTLIWIAPEVRHKDILSFMPSDDSFILLGLNFSKRNPFRWAASYLRRVYSHFNASHSVSYRFLQKYFSSLYLDSVIKRFNVDQVFCLAFMNQVPPGGTIPTSGILHDVSPDLPTHCLQTIEEWIYRSSSIFCVSEFTATQLAHQLSAEKTVSPHVIPPCPRKAHQFDSTSIPSSPPTTDPLEPSLVRLRCFMPANLQQRKGHHILLEAACRVVEKGYALSLTFVGGSTDLLAKLRAPSSSNEEHLLRLVSQAESLGVHITAHGHVDENLFSQLLSSADVVVFPSLYEGFGLPVSESIRAGIPVITSDLPPIREQLDLFDCHHRACLLPPGDVSALAETLCRYSQGDLPPRIDPSLLTPNFQRWTWSNVADQIIETLSQE